MVTSYRRTQAIFQEQLQSEGSPKTLLVVAVHDHDAQGDDEKTKDAIYQDLQAIWATVPKVCTPTEIQ